MLRISYSNRNNNAGLSERTNLACRVLNMRYQNNTQSESLAGYVVRNRILRWCMFAALQRLITRFISMTEIYCSIMSLMFKGELK